MGVALQSLFKIKGIKNMKLCKDCKYGETYDVFFCRRLERIELCHGEIDRDSWTYARLERRDGPLMSRLKGSCGKEGRFWEAKP